MASLPNFWPLGDYTPTTKYYVYVTKPTTGWLNPPPAGGYATGYMAALAAVGALQGQCAYLQQVTAPTNQQQRDYQAGYMQGLTDCKGLAQLVHLAKFVHYQGRLPYARPLAPA